MASAWGKSWGKSFGAAWGSVTQVPPPVVNPSRGGMAGLAFVYGQHPKTQPHHAPRSRRARDADLLLLHRF